MTRVRQTGLRPLTSIWEGLKAQIRWYHGTVVLCLDDGAFLVPAIKERKDADDTRNRNVN